MRRACFAAVLLAAGAALPAAAQTTGKITGQLIYPSDQIPPDLTVCAEAVDGGRTVCTDRHLKGPKRTTIYEIAVPAGAYRVYAKLTDPESTGASYGLDYRAYYSEFVTCGLKASCPSHAPIIVRVAPGRTAGKIDPADWYDPAQ